MAALPRVQAHGGYPGCRHLLTLRGIEKSLHDFRPPARLIKLFDRFYAARKLDAPATRRTVTLFRRARTKVLLSEGRFWPNLFEVQRFASEDTVDGRIFETERSRYLVLYLPEALFDTEIEAILESHEWVHAVIDCYFPEVRKSITDLRNSFGRRSFRAADLVAELHYLEERIAMMVEWHLVQMIPKARVVQLLKAVEAQKELDPSAMHEWQQILGSRVRTLKQFLYDSQRTRDYTLKSLTDAYREEQSAAIGFELK